EATFPTRHAIGLRSDAGVLTLIHIGVGTVDMRGTGFVQYVEKGDHVKQGQELIEFWAPAIKKAGLDDTVMVVITNHDRIGNLEFTKTTGEVKHGDKIAEMSEIDPTR
ncbi:PTS glucose transporter subunit IIA, partial [Companilactobacillus sp.]